MWHIGWHSRLVARCFLGDQVSHMGLGGLGVPHRTGGTGVLHGTRHFSHWVVWDADDTDLTIYPSMPCWHRSKNLHLSLLHVYNPWSHFCIIDEQLLRHWRVWPVSDARYTCGCRVWVTSAVCCATHKCLLAPLLQNVLIIFINVYICQLLFCHTVLFVTNVVSV